VTEVAVGVDSEAVWVMDGPTDDYESWDGELNEDLRQCEVELYVYNLTDSRGGRFSMTFRQYRTEAAIAQSRQAVLVSGAWKT